MAWAAATRLASLPCPMAASTAVMVVPMLSPSKMGMAAVSPSRLCTPSAPGCAAMLCSSATVAELLCTVKVMQTPASSPCMGLCCTRASSSRSRGLCSSGSMALRITVTPSNSSPKPNTASPTQRPRQPLQARQSSTPPNSSRYRQLSTRNASSCAVTVVPIFAPNTTGTACRSCNSPAARKAITMTVTAELLCSTAVTAAPVSSPAAGFAVHRASRLRRRLPAPCCTARHRLSVPYKNSANPPNTCNNTWNPCSICTLRFCLSFIFMQREPVCALTKPTSFL